VASALLDRLDALKAVHPVFARIDRARILGVGLSAPLHEGVLRTLGGQ